MLGNLYDRALAGEACWLRYEDGRVHRLPVHRWLGNDGEDLEFDKAIVEHCHGRTIDLGCGPGRLLTHLRDRGLPALGVDQSEEAVRLARSSGATVLHGDLFDPLPDTGRWQTVLLADGNIGLGGDPHRVLRRAAELLVRGGRCLAEVDPHTTGLRSGWVRLESPHAIGPWFRWAAVGIDAAATLAADTGMALSRITKIGERFVATLHA